MIEKSDLTSCPEPSPRDIFEALMIRRENQDAEYGGPGHDDQHTQSEWIAMIIVYSQRSINGRISFEDTMLDVAALAFAAIESQARIAADARIGSQEGDRCNRDGCDGRMEWKKPADCSCHLAPPCAACEAAPLICSECKTEFDDRRRK
jgi:hypothetical protein